MHAKAETRFLTSPEVAAACGASPRASLRKRVLVIDDDELLLQVMKDLLAESGFDVELARHGFLAGYLVGHCRPDVLVLDILMPGLDGYQVLSLLRRRPEARAIPVVACTSLQGPEVEAQLRAAGFDAYVRKPIDLRELLRAVEGLAGRDRAGGDPGGAPPSA